MERTKANILRHEAVPFLVVFNSPDDPQYLINIEINKYTGEDSQKFYITQNSDGSYIIKTKITNNNSAVEIADAGKGSGDNVQQWSLNNYPNQDWIFEPATMSLKLRGKNVNNSEKSNEKEVIKTEMKVKDNIVGSFLRISFDLSHINFISDTVNN